MTENKNENYEGPYGMNIFFPEAQKKQGIKFPEKDENHTFYLKNGSFVNFMYGGDVPEYIRKDPEIAKRLPNPRETVISDVTSIEDILSELREKASLGEFSTTVYCNKNKKGIYLFYDYSAIEGMPREFFKHIFPFKKIPIEVLDKKYHKMKVLSEYVKERSVPFIVGNTLREAASRAMEIYGMETEILEASKLFKFLLK